MTTFKEYMDAKEETTTNEETFETMTDLIVDGFKMYKKAKTRLVAKGFMVGVVTALAVQSLATIIVMLISK